MAKLFNMHPSDDQLDRYLVGHLPFAQARWLEEHYLICPRCLSRLSTAADFIAVLRGARVECPDLFTTTFRYVPRTPRHLEWSAHWNLFTRLAAALIVGIGTAVICEAPALPGSAQPMKVPVQAEAPASIKLEQPKPIPLQYTKERVLNQTDARRSRVHVAFRPPPRRQPPAMEAASLELPEDLAMEFRADPILELLEPPPVPPFQARRHWFRRMLGAVRRSLIQPQ